MTPAVKSGVDPSLIPAADVTNLCRDTLAAAERFYQDPQNVRRYEAWLAERRKAHVGKPDLCAAGC